LARWLNKQPLSAGIVCFPEMSVVPYAVRTGLKYGPAILRTARAIKQYGPTLVNAYRSFSNKRMPATPPRSRASSTVSMAAGPAKRARIGAGRRRRIRGGQRRSIGRRNSKGRRSKIISRSRRNPVQRIMTNGIFSNTEKGGTTSADRVIYIGHANGPSTTLVLNMCYALVKKLAIKCGFDPSDFKQGYPDIIGDGTEPNSDKWQINYRPDESSTSVDVNLESYPVAGTSTFQSIAENLFDKMKVLGPTVTFQTMSFIPANATSRNDITSMNLMGASLEFSLRSTLVVQNRSVTDGDDDSDDVDNVPLIGRVVSGKGNGTKYIDKQGGAGAFISDNTGFINREIGMETTSLGEPPFAQAFLGAKRQSGIYIPSGAVKTTVLANNFKIGLQTFIRKVFIPNSGTPLEPQRTTIGQYKLWSVEKQLETSSTTPSDIVLAFQVQQSIGCSVNVTRRTYTSKVLWFLG